jgi:hypothetical protein
MRFDNKKIFCYFGKHEKWEWWEEEFTETTQLPQHFIEIQVINLIYGCI